MKLRFPKIQKKEVSYTIGVAYFMLLAKKVVKIIKSLVILILGNILKIN